MPLRHWDLCLELIDENRFSLAGAEVCKNISPVNDTQRCLRVIAGKNISEEFAQICANMSHIPNRVIDCLRFVTNRQDELLSLKGTKICVNMLSYGDMADCFKAITGESMPKHGVEICNNIASDPWKISCFELIAGKNLSEEAQFCAHYSPRQTMECLQRTVGDRETFLSQESAEEICGQVTDDFDREKCLMFFTSSLSYSSPPYFFTTYLANKVANLCARMHPRMKERCLETIDGQIFPQTGVEICEDLYPDNANGTNSCLEAIAGKRLSERNASICRNKNSKHKVVDCLIDRTEEVEVSSYQINLFGPNWHILPLPYNDEDNEFYYYMGD